MTVRRGRRALGAALVVAATLAAPVAPRPTTAAGGPGGAVAAPPRAAVAGPDGEPGSLAPARAGGQAEGGIRLASQTAWASPEGEFVVRFVVPDDPGPASGPGPPAEPDPGDPVVEVTVHDRITSRSAFQQTLEGRALGGVVARTSAPLALLDLDPGGARVVRLGLTAEPGDPDRVLLRREGVYPVRLTVRPGDGADDAEPAELVTHLVRAPADRSAIEPLRVAMVIPLDSLPGLQTDGSRALLGTEVRRLAAITAAVDTSADIPLTYAPTPEVLESAAASEESDAIVERLRRRRAGAEVMAGSYVRVDPATLVAADLEEELGRQLEAGTDTLARLLAEPPEPRTWLLGSGIDSDALGALRRSGIDQLTLPASALVPLSLRVTLAQPFEVTDGQGGRARAAVPDEDLAAHLDLADDPVAAAHRFLADLAVLFFDNPALVRGAVVQLPLDWAPDARAVETALGGLSNSPIVEPVTLGDWFAEIPPLGGEDDPTERELVEVTPRPPEVLHDIAPLRDRLESFSSMLTGDDGTGARLVEELILAAQAAALTTVERTSYLAAATAALDEHLGRIEVPTRRTVTLTARIGEIPVTIRNDTGGPVRVVVSLDSDKLNFPDGSQRSLELAAGNTTERFTVEARTSGAFPLRVIVTSPDGQTLLGQSRYTIRSTAISGVGLVLTGSAVTFLIGWWGLHLRRGRRDKAAPA